MELHSYRRVLRPERMIYHLESGRALPVPIPFGAALWFGATFAVVFLFRSGAPIVMLAIAAAGAALGYLRAKIPGALAGAVLGWSVFQVGSFLLGLPGGTVGWVVVHIGIPLAVAGATAGVRPDGRPLHNYVLAYARWLAGPKRMTIDGREVPERGTRIAFRPSEMRYTPDWRSPILRAGRLRPRDGEALVHFAVPVRARRTRRGRWIVRPATARLRKSKPIDELRIGAGETAEVRP